MTDYVLFLRKTNDSATSFVTELAAAWLLTAQSINTAGGGDHMEQYQGHGHQNIDTCCILLQQLVRH